MLFGVALNDLALPQSRQSPRTADRTKWLPNHAADRAAIGGGDNGLIAPDPAAVRRLPRFAVGLFKCETYPGNRGNGILHRSPPVTVAGGPRLLLRLDEAK